MLKTRKTEYEGSFKAAFEKKYAYFKQTSQTFSQRAKEHMAARDWNATVFMEKTELAQNLYYKIVRNEAESPSVESVLSICIGLQLNTREREEMLALAGHVLQNNLKHYAYIHIFDEYKIRNVCDFNEIFKALEIDGGKAPLSSLA